MKNLAEKPSQLITKEFAKQLNLNYNNKKAQLTAKSSRKEDANAIWYSLEALESYIHYIKTHGANSGYEVDGIRFYFGVYPDDEKHGEKAGLTTLFLSATGRKTNTDSDDSTNKVQGFVAAKQAASADIQSLEPMNYGNIGRPPSLIY
ncbi:hypothetical protein [Flavobacterium sp. HTF]|uniref:hypothetical protein n=1 Tax=Flavobacterium sp. HTF TaxID=2170732 RepID=UPI000D5C41AB|nr:hypothetical protein [Flavobacterium sp. HTF]PWB24682.1 hypothetical protein DCO46_11245 [Flavobacterium sp. HTF]